MRASGPVNIPGKRAREPQPAGTPPRGWPHCASPPDATPLARAAGRPANTPGPAVQPIRIGEREIGPGRRAYVIAEAGVNHDGQLEQALALVDAAAEAGADAVKFQLFRADELVTAGAAAAEYQRAAGACSQREMLARLELDDSEFARIAAHCRTRGVEFLATPFGLPDVDRLRRLNVPAFKLASTDLNNVPLLQRLAETGLPLIVSTGAATAGEIASAVRRLRAWGAAERLALLHCVSRYPTPLEAANLRAIVALRDAYRVPTGFSDHTRSMYTGAWAVAAGACLVEKHITLERDTPGRAHDEGGAAPLEKNWHGKCRRSPDHAFSLAPREMREFVRHIRAVEGALGTGELGLTELELEVRRLARRSIVARRHIRTGTALAPDMLSLKRPAGGIPPEQLELTLGRRARHDIAPDTPITWAMLED